MLADDDAPLEVCPRRENDSRRKIRLSRLRQDATHRSILDDDLLCKKLLDFEHFLSLTALLHQELIHLLVLLRAQRMDSRPFSRIQEAVLQRRFIGVERHGAAQGVDLPHKVALRRAADGRIARHERDVVQGKRRQKRAAAKLRRRERRFDARVPGAEDDDIILASDKQKRSPHLPTQKRENISWRTSSPTVSPVISPSFSSAERRSIETKSNPGS